MTLDEMRAKLRSEEEAAKAASLLPAKTTRSGQSYLSTLTGHRSQQCMGITHNNCVDPLCECVCHDCDMFNFCG